MIFKTIKNFFSINQKTEQMTPGFRSISQIIKNFLGLNHTSNHSNDVSSSQVQDHKLSSTDLLQQTLNLTLDAQLKQVPLKGVSHANHTAHSPAIFSEAKSKDLAYSNAESSESPLVKSALSHPTNPMSIPPPILGDSMEDIGDDRAIL